MIFGPTCCRSCRSLIDIRPLTSGHDLTFASDAGLPWIPAGVSLADAQRSSIDLTETDRQV